MITDPEARDTVDAIRRAMAYRVRMRATAPGVAQSALRKAIMGSANPYGAPTRDKAAKVMTHLSSHTIRSMPPPAGDLSLLIDIICMRHGYTARAEGWRHIGINPNRGRAFLGQNAQAIDWPIWVVAFHGAFGRMPG